MTVVWNAPSRFCRVVVLLWMVAAARSQSGHGLYSEYRDSLPYLLEPLFWDAPLEEIQIWLFRIQQYFKFAAFNCDQQKRLIAQDDVFNCSILGHY